MPSLLAVISSHGFGHIAQTAPVVNAIAASCPGLRVTVQCAAPHSALVEHFAIPFEHIETAADFGMLMANSLDVLIEESHERYLAFHADWDRRVAEYADWLSAQGYALVLANIAYLPLAAAKRAGIPAFALCSLNWADIYYPYCRHLPGADAIHVQMITAYRDAVRFLIPTPGMAMPRLDNVEVIGPIARRGRNRRAEIDTRLGLAPAERLVLVFMGGVPTELGVGSWPSVPGVRYLVAGAKTGVPYGNHDSIIDFDALGLPYIDVMASCDALITKPGYGGFAEAAANGVPVLYTRRENWPEAEFLVDWLAANGRCAEIPRVALERGAIAESLHALWALAPRPPVTPNGVREAADRILGLL
jgi:UDP:flavonoid glycosyltransferase YjiC (YdhE family)